jgi:hypothetical protein
VVNIDPTRGSVGSTAVRLLSTKVGSPLSRV